MIRSFLPFIYPFKAVSIVASLRCVSVTFTTGSAYPGSCCVQQQQWRWQTPKQETLYSESSPLMHLWGTTINSIKYCKDSMHRLVFYMYSTYLDVLYLLPVCSGDALVWKVIDRETCHLARCWLGIQE